MQITIGATTLADDTASPRKAAVIESWSGAAIVQSVPLYHAANQVKNPQGNVAGQISFTVGCSYATSAAAIAAMAAAYALLNTQATLSVIQGATTVVMANAVLREVARAELHGVFLKLRYTFEITTVA